MKVLPENRKKLVEEHSYIVRIVAARIRNGLPQYIDFEFDDLMGYGYIGLVDAGIKYDKSTGYKFSTYANKRVEGAILDGMRTMDWLTTGLRRGNYKIEKPISIDEINKDGQSPDTIIDDKNDQIEKMLLRQFMLSSLIQLEWKRFCCLYLYYFEGYKEKEIAVMLGVSPSRISQLTSDGRRIMGGMLDVEWKDNHLSI